MQTEQIEIKARLDLALDCAFEAEKTILKYYLDPDLKIDFKRDQTVVTEADREAEKLIRARILKTFPHDAVIGEELGETAGTSGFKWILDPIDGTQSFICGVPLFGTMLGLAYNAKPVAGVIHMPALKETFFASTGQGSWWMPPGQQKALRAKASNATLLKQSLFCSTSHSGFERIGRMDLFESLLKRTKKFRGWGSCYGHALVATGRVDIMIDPDVKIWDLAAAYPIVTEAGGRFFDLKSQARIDTGSGISCAPGLAVETMALL
jgi:histidinol-phosphatase